MCLILVAWQAHPDYPLVVAANRDEFFARQTAGAAFWNEASPMLAGRDLKAGGTWLGITRCGRFAALTNYRDPASHKSAAPSRGRLVADFLQGDRSIDDYLDALDSSAYNGFNLLLGDGNRLVAFSNVSGARHELAPGVHGLSNHLLDTPWPKVGAGKTALAAALAALPDETALFRLLCDDRIHADETLPVTGVSLEWERLLSAAFIRGRDYGTRCSTVVTVGTGPSQADAPPVGGSEPILRARGAIHVGADRTVSFDEQSWLPGGGRGERRRFRFRSGPT